jgi:hypothetical protein
MCLTFLFGHTRERLGLVRNGHNHGLSVGSQQGPVKLEPKDLGIRYFSIHVHAW